MASVGRLWLVMLLVLTPAFSGAWRDERREPREPREMRRPGVHYHSKRHMMLTDSKFDKRLDKTTVKPLLRKKPTGHLAPLHEDEMENDEVVSVAIGPPPIRPKFDKYRKSQGMTSTKETKFQPPNSTAVNLVKDVLTVLGKEFLTQDLNENFVFGQYVGNSMKNLTKELRLKMQHEILDLILKYQNLNSNETKKEEIPEKNEIKIDKIEKIEKKFVSANETDESWPDFTNLAKMVG